MDYNRKFKCKYCDYRGNREQLVNHTERKHSEYVTEEYPAARIVYNYLNHVENGKCIICGKPTKWNDKTWKYYRHCGSNECKEKIKETYRKNAIAAKGTYNFAKDPEHLEKMLAGRRISGTYVFPNGTKKTYTGSYERKTLELMPGPIIQYEYKGKTHNWITDIYYIPYNLIIEVKDGGDNPNRREMTEYREKQLAKEKAIIAMNNYNYLRLTNNNFVQLFQMMASLRIAMVNDIDETRKAMIQINESNDGIICANKPSPALVFIYNEFGYVNKIGLTDLSSEFCIIPENGTLIESKLSDYNKKSIYFFNDTSKVDISTIVSKFNNKENVSDYEIFESLLDKKFISPTQLILETNLIPMNTCPQIYSTLTQNSLDHLNTLGYDCTYVSNLDEYTIKKLEDFNVVLKSSIDGYYLETTSIYPALATEPTNSLYDTLSQLNLFTLLINRCGGDN